MEKRVFNSSSLSPPNSTPHNPNLINFHSFTMESSWGLFKGGSLHKLELENHLVMFTKCGKDEE
jgi:hypothetical protein